MQDRESRQLIDPEPMTIHLPMLPGVNEGRIRRIGHCTGNGVCGERSALQRVENSFAGQRFDHPGGVADVHQVWALRLNCRSRQGSDRLPMVLGRQPEFLCCFLAKSVRMFRPANQTQVCQAFSDRGQPEITVLAELQGDMGLAIGRKMSLKANPVGARLWIFRQQPGDGRISSIRRDKELRLDRLVVGGDLPARTVFNLQDRIPESDLGSRRDGMFDQGVIEKFSTDSALSPVYVWKLKSNRAPSQIKELDPAQFGGGQIYR